MPKELRRLDCLKDIKKELNRLRKGEEFIFIRRDKDRAVTLGFTNPAFTEEVAVNLLKNSR